jgi:hypothetical protein
MVFRGSGQVSTYLSFKKVVELEGWGERIPKALPSGLAV